MFMLLLLVFDLENTSDVEGAEDHSCCGTLASLSLLNTVQVEVPVLSCV